MKAIPLITVFSVVLAAGAARAAVAIENLATGSQSSSLSISGPTAVGFFGGQFNDREVAFSFTTGPEAVFLEELKFVIAVGSGTSSPLQISLSEGLSAPGGTNPLILGTASPVQGGGTVQTLTITPTLPPILTASTLYWAHVTVPAGNSVYSFNNTNTPTFASGWSLGNTWFYSPGSGWQELTSGPVARIRMTVEAVPEPQSALLGGLGMFMLLRRRRIK